MTRKAEAWRMEQPEYVRRLLDAYRATPGTTGMVRRADRLLAAQLHERDVPLEAVENALTLAVARRMARPADAPPLSTIRSLRTFRRSSKRFSKHNPVWSTFSICAAASPNSTPTVNTADDKPRHASGVDDTAAFASHS